MARARGRRQQRARARVLARSTICGLCGHPGANTLGHIVPVKIRPDLEWDPANHRPEHGPKAGRPGGCTTPGCTCPGNYGQGARPHTPTPTREW